MQSADSYKHVEIEHIGVENPLYIEMSNFTSIEGLELQTFAYSPSFPPTRILGIMVEGIRGVYNAKGVGVPCLKSIPIEGVVTDPVSGNISGGTFKFEGGDHEGDCVQYLGQGNTLVITFVDRNSPVFGGSLIAFDNNYLLNISLLLKA